MTSTQPHIDPAVAPADPAMAASDPAMFAALTADDNWILRHHLTSGWVKQAAVYPTLSEPWRETHVLLNDLYVADQARRDAQRTAQAEQEPEAGS